MNAAEEVLVRELLALDALRRCSPQEEAYGELLVESLRLWQRLRVSEEGRAAVERALGQVRANQLEAFLILLAVKDTGEGEVTWSLSS